MKFRDVVIPGTGEQFSVPQGIQRIDSPSTHGWQLRYRGETKLYSDREYGGSAESLSRATKELLRRIARLPAPSGLQRTPNTSKTSQMPVGISGPLLRVRTGGSARYAIFLVSIPRFGEKPRRASVYIGSETTYTPERYEAALAKAMALREKAEKAYQRAATQAKRADARALAETL
ncbi:hypothetical protein [Aquabacterium sp.]|uniref:hypothetical protein n=1 Tax=Aquabacterium sp. TaxID=1872578 RepID=UPI003783D5F8